MEPGRKEAEGEAAAAAKRPGVFRAGGAGGQPSGPGASLQGPLVPRTSAVHSVELRVGLLSASWHQGLEGGTDCSHGSHHPQRESEAERYSHLMEAGVGEVRQERPPDVSLAF